MSIYPAQYGRVILLCNEQMKSRQADHLACRLRTAGKHNGAALMVNAVPFVILGACMAYDIVQQLTAVKIFQASGESRLTSAVFDEIRAAVGDVSRPTVRGWIKKHGGTPEVKENFQEEKKQTPENFDTDAAHVNNVRQQVSLELAAKCEKAAHVYLDHAVKPDVVKATTGPSAMTAAAIAIDKRHKLLGLDNQTLTVLVKVIDALEQRDLSPGDVFEAMLQQLVAT